MDKLIVFLLLLLILVNVLIVLRLSKNRENFKNLNLSAADKAIPLWRVFAFLKFIGLPREIGLEYATTLRAKNPEEQSDLDEIIGLMKNNSVVVNDKNIERIKKIYKIQLDSIGLVNSLNYLRAHIDANRIYKPITILITWY